MSEAHKNGRNDFLGHRNWNPPDPVEDVAAYQAYSQGWAEGRAIAIHQQYGHQDLREFQVVYPGGRHFYFPWDQQLAERVIQDAGGGTYIETGRTVEDAIRQMNADLDAIRRQTNEEG